MYFNDYFLILSIQKDWPVWMKEKKIRNNNYNALTFVNSDFSKVERYSAMLNAHSLNTIFLIHHIWLLHVPLRKWNFFGFFFLSQCLLWVLRFENLEKKMLVSMNMATLTFLSKCSKNHSLFQTISDMRQLKPHTVCFFSFDLLFHHFCKIWPTRCSFGRHKCIRHQDEWICN